jgi:hypothetical protein
VDRGDEVRVTRHEDHPVCAVAMGIVDHVRRDVDVRAFLFGNLEFSGAGVGTKGWVPPLAFLALCLSD